MEDVMLTNGGLKTSWCLFVLKVIEGRARLLFTFAQVHI